MGGCGVGRCVRAVKHGLLVVVPCVGSAHLARQVQQVGERRGHDFHERSRAGGDLERGSTDFTVVEQPQQSFEDWDSVPHS